MWQRGALLGRFVIFGKAISRYVLPREALDWLLIEIAAEQKNKRDSNRCPAVSHQPLPGQGRAEAGYVGIVPL